MIRQKEIKEFENDWIEKLKKFPDEPADLEAWLSVEEWSDEGIEVIFDKSI